ncbi:MAG: amidohydrolase [Oscillospiraceae bacterium]|nr:amidohydrolase [Oscillospiraceae bacterium]
MQAIDIHSHIGDILYENGGELIFKTGIKFPESTGLQRFDEKYLFRKTRCAAILEAIFPMWATNCERRRNAAATLQNFQQSFETGTDTEDIKIIKSVCLPVAPNTRYSDMCAAAAADSRIIAFTSPDFKSTDTEAALAADLENGAAGVKIHPIIQEIEADSDKVMRAVELSSAYNVPVILHTGSAVYYTRRENKQKFNGYASIKKIEKLISAFPSVRFIAGHAGLREIGDVIDLLSKYKNAYADTSFQHPEAIAALIAAFGGSRVLFASDWPYGLRRPAVLAVMEACGADLGLRRAVFYDNAAELLGLL